MDPLVLANLAIAMANSGRKPAPSSEHQAIVLRADKSGTYWVRIPGGADETPIRTSYVDAIPGDVVSVTIAGGSATMRGNATSPSASGRTVTQVSQTATTALQNAVDAGIAASSALESALLAGDAATAAQTSADTAYDAAQEAIGSASSAEEAASAAWSKAADAEAAAGAAQESAGEALTSANQAARDAAAANRAANGALAGLGTLENVVDTVNWIAEHKQLTTDTSVVEGKDYYVLDEATGTLSKAEPIGTENPSEEGWYELSEGIGNFIASHVATTADGLYVVGLSNGWRVLVSSGAGNYTAGVFLIDPYGTIAQATTNTGITFDPTKSYYVGNNNAYIAFDGNGSMTIGGSGVSMTGGVTIGGYNQTLSEILDDSINAIEYGIGNSPTSHSDIASWSSASPTWQDGKYTWMRTSTNGLTYTYTCIQGAKGRDGDDGAQILGITTAPSSYTTEVGDFTPVYRIALSTVKTQSGATEVRVGDMLAYSYYHYPVGHVDASYAYCGTRKSLRGATGATGDTGPQGATGEQGPQGTSVYVKSASKTGDVTTVVLTDGTTDTTLTITDGLDGQNGTPGLNGYVHTAWATSADGSEGFSTTVSAGKTYLGVCTNNTEPDPTDYRAYNWSLIKGEKGDAAYAYTLTCNPLAVVRSESGALSPTTIALSSTRAQGTGSPSAYAGRFKVEKYVNGAWASTPVYTSSSNESSKSVSIPTDAKLTLLRCSLYLAGGTTTLLDQQTVPVLSDGASVTVTNTEYAYQLSESGTTVPTGNWSTSPVAPTTSQFAWTRTTTTYSDGNEAVTYTVGGKVGQGGTSVTISSKSVTYQTSTSGTTTPTGNWQETVPTVAQGSYLWTKTVVTYSDGNSTTAYSVGRMGEDGNDAYTVVLSNESHTFPAGTSAAIASSTTCAVIAYKGTSQVAATIGTISGAPTGMSTSISNNGTTSASITVSATTSLTTKSGTLTVPVTVDGKSFTKSFTWALALTGQKGDSGKMLYGTCGTAANTSPKSVTCADATELYAGMTITVKFSLENTVLDPTLKVNSLDAKPIWVDNAVTSTSNCLFWNKNALITFTYDGTEWLVVDQPTTYYTTCSTAAGTPAKAAPCTTGVVRKGTTVTATMSYAHTSSTAATLYVNGQSGTARTIYVNGATVTNSAGNSWAAGESVPFVFNGQYWYASRGEKGDKGDTPAITATKSGSTTTIKVDGTTIATVEDGTDGTTPTVTTRTNQDGSTTIVINGSDSATIENGTDGKSYYTYVRYSENSNGSNMVSTPTASTKYIGVYTGQSSSVPAYTSFTWSKYVGENGTSPDPLTVTGTAVDYQLSESGTTKPTGNWSATPLAPTTTQYLWTRTTITFSDGSDVVTYSVGGKVGQKGDTGPEAVVTIYPTAIDWGANTATLAVSLRVNGTITTPSSYKWTKGTSTTSLGTAATLAVTSSTGGLNETYHCTVTW